MINNLTGKKPKPRLATLAKIKTLKNKIIDEGLVVYFPKKQSFTGEEVAEFHIHGSTAIIEKLLKELGKIKGLRPAKQGEFTKQAYLNGKMNLLQVEGLSSLIQAETEAQREKALETYLDENSKIHFSWLQELKSASDAGLLIEMFGAGTAAVIAPIQSITFHEEELRVNAHNESELSKRLLDTILGIQHGTLADTHGWTVKI